MPVPTTIDQLSTTAASNYPQGSDSPSTLDDTQRAHGSFIAKIRDLVGLITGTYSASTAIANMGITPAAIGAQAAGSYATSGANTNITSLTGLTGALGWGAGGGGFVTQLTSKSTSVTLNAYSGVIQTNNAALLAGTTVSFLLTCLCNANDVVVVSLQNGTPDSYNIWTSNNSLGANQQRIYIKNISAGTLSEALNINFAVIRVQPS